MIAIPGALMISTETWLFEVLSFAAGTYGALPLSIYGLSFQIVMLPLIMVGGFVVAVATRVSNSLGAGDGRSARNAAHTAFIVVQVIAALYAIVLFCARQHIGKIFTDDPHVVDGLAKVIYVILTIMFLSVIQQVIAGVLHGSGKQLAGSIANVVGYDCIALPLALVLAKYWKGGDDAAQSLWWGVAVGVACVFVAMIIIFLWMDWNVEVERAHKRVSEIADTSNGQKEDETSKDSATYV